MICYVAIKMNRKEQMLKRKYMINYNEGDVIFEGKSLTKLLCFGFIGGWVAGALGLGGGSIYNPALLSLGVNPRTSGSTGMYLVLYSSINSCVSNYLSANLNIPYGLWISFWSAIGSMAGLVYADRYAKKSGRQSIFVLVLVVVFLLSVVMTPIFGAFSIKKQSENGIGMWQFQPACKKE
jgi:uncharacterized membrane protein YfcA